MYKVLQKTRIFTNFNTHTKADFVYAETDYKNEQYVTTRLLKDVRKAYLRINYTH